MIKKKKGFTLIEMIAAIAMFAIISLVFVSMISFAFKINSINRQTYESDTNSKIFFETLKKNENKIPKPITPEPAQPSPRAPNNGRYIMTFNNGSDEIDTFVQNKLLQNKMTLMDLDPRTDMDDMVAFVKAIPSAKDYAIVIEIKWDTESEVFEIETWSWEISKGKVSMVSRKTLIGPKI